MESRNAVGERKRKQEQKQKQQQKHYQSTKTEIGIKGSSANLCGSLFPKTAEGV